jgi:hypothetical protein
MYILCAISIQKVTWQCLMQMLAIIINKTEMLNFMVAIQKFTGVMLQGNCNLYGLVACQPFLFPHKMAQKTQSSSLLSAQLPYGYTIHKLPTTCLAFRPLSSTHIHCWLHCSHLTSTLPNVYNVCILCCLSNILGHNTSTSSLVKMLIWKLLKKNQVWSPFTIKV